MLYWFLNLSLLLLKCLLDSTIKVPFIIARKNMSLPQCALEKVRDVSTMEINLTSAAPTVEVNDPVL